MEERFDTIITSRAYTFLAEKYNGSGLTVHPVEGGYSRNRRAIIDVNDESFFVKEVDTNILPDDGEIELGWLKKDYEVANELGKCKVDIVPDWVELHLNGHLLLMPCYKKEDGWQWSLPSDEDKRAVYIHVVINATKQLEAIILPEDLTEKLSLQPFFRDELAYYDGITPILNDQELRGRLIKKYINLKDSGNHLFSINEEMVEMLKNDESLKELQRQAVKLSELPNDCLNHCDVRSDNIVYNEITGRIKFVDWNWASYAPAKFGATEFLLDMARRGVDVSPWFKDMDVNLLAATVGYYMIRSLRDPLAPGNTLREMQAETAAVANYLYNRLK